MKRKSNKNSNRLTVFQENIRKSYGYIAEMQSHSEIQRDKKNSM